MTIFHAPSIASEVVLPPNAIHTALNMNTILAVMEATIGLLGVICSITDFYPTCGKNITITNNQIDII
jgi:hypothetical protein